MAESGAPSLGRPLTFTAACICRATGRPGRCLSPALPPSPDVTPRPFA